MHLLTKTTLLLGASILILIGFVLLVIGLASDTRLWMLGLGILAAAMLISFATRFAPEGEEVEADAEAAEPEPRSPPTR